MHAKPRTLATMTSPYARGKRRLRRRKIRGWIGWTALGLLALTLLVLMVWEGFAAEASTPPPRRDYRAEIIRDQFGVPHIYGKTDADVAYGLARVHSEDDFATLQDVVAMTDVLGINPLDPHWTGAPTDSSAHDVLDALITARLADRDTARADRDFAQADSIRNELSALGITIEDTPKGARWALDS